MKSLKHLFRPLLMATAGVAGMTMSAGAVAGPFILDLTDADDHGSAGADGWFYMQRVLENLAPGVTNTYMNVVSLGSTNTGSSTDSYDAALSSFNTSTLGGAG